MTAQAAEAGEEQAPAKTGVYPWYVLTVILLLVIVSWADRQVLALLVEPLKRDLNLRDWQIGILQGLAFALFFAVAGLPLGLLADRANRRNVMVAGATIWSIATAACGFATSFLGLFVGRIGVAVGEATLRPCADSMIADYFPRARLGLAFGIYMSGIVVGVGASFVLGAAAIQALSGMGPLVVPVLGRIAVWQAAFLAVGLPGLVIALLGLTIAEPIRRNAAGQTRASVSLTFAFIGRNWRVYLAHFFGYSLVSLVGLSVHAWGVTFLIRSFHMLPVEAGYSYGICVLVFATAGVLMGGVVSRWLTKRGFEDAYWRLPVYSGLLSAPLVAIAFLMPTPTLSLCVISAWLFVNSMVAGMNPASLQSITPNQFRGQMTALTTVASLMFAQILGPLSVGLLTDFVFHNPAALRYALAIVGAVCTPLYTFVFWISLPTYRAALKRNSSIVGD